MLPEPQAVHNYFNTQGPSIAHLSLHGMAIAAGCWFLLDGPAQHHAGIWRDCLQIAETSGLGLHEFYRYGDKGFRRMGHGFCRPRGPAMRRWAQATNQPRLAAGFGYGSMDDARARNARHGKPAPYIGVSEVTLLHSTHPAPTTGWRDAFCQRWTC